jgi:SAM-dependent methyltransferase
MNQGEVTFSFGKNWKEYLATVGDEEIDGAKRNIEKWLGNNPVSGKTVLDIGSGSGIHSLAFYLLGAKTVRSFDYDKHSVEATKALWEKQGKPQNWEVSHGSILDAEHLKSYREKFDLVYSWGVLHHTGSMWEAVGNSITLVKPGGKLWIALYVKGPKYQDDLALKQRYNDASPLGKKWMVNKWVARIMIRRLLNFQNPLKWNEKRSRGMNIYNDIIDWLGGLPYEVASEDEVLSFCRKKGLILERVEAAPEGGCSDYVFSLPSGQEQV